MYQCPRLGPPAPIRALAARDYLSCREPVTSNDHALIGQCMINVLAGEFCSDATFQIDVTAFLASEFELASSGTLIAGSSLVVGYT